MFPFPLRANIYNTLTVVEDPVRGGYPLLAGVRLNHGFLINHHNTMKIFNEKIPYSYELFIAKVSDGEKSWHKFYRYPNYGVSYAMIDLGSPTYLKKTHCIYPFMNFFLTNQERVANLSIRFGAGVAYVNKIFHPVDNYKNTAISTPLNAILNLGVEGRLRIADPFYISGGCSFIHLSNGTFKKPNTGLNYVMASVGVFYAFGKRKEDLPLFGSRPLTELKQRYDDDEINRVLKKNQYTIYFSGGIKTYSTYDEKKYIASGLSFEASRSHLTNTRVSGTLDLFYDTSDYAYFVREEIEVTKTEMFKPGFAAGYVFIFDALSANVQIGRYFYAKQQKYGMIYQRLALRYVVSSRFNVHLGLKTHWGQADYIELALGYRI